ncbi:MAG TPA: M15 family metallopeptidase [Labilithrix sp.]|nr:M15 family metallopeptidase [Labilithrix sp.]
MLAQKVALLFAFAVAAAPFYGCAAVTGDDDGDDQEEEGVGETNDELRSAVSCKEQTATAYQSGKPFSIQVINVGGKAVSKTTGHAFLKMQAAANTAGVKLSLTSGFRTQAEQTHLYNCYRTGSCNNGNLAARPGYSNHQNGFALDLSTSSWLTKNASKYGFVRTVPKEAWHYEYHGKDPGGPCTKGSTPTGADDAPTGADDPSTEAPLPAAGALKWVAPTQDSQKTNGFTVKSHSTSATIVKVVYSQGTFEFGTSTAAASDFALDYTFQYMGDKTLTVKGYDASDKLIAQDNVDFTLLP